MRPILTSIFNVVLAGTLASVLLRLSPVTLALVIVMAAPYVIIWNLANR